MAVAIEFGSQGSATSSGGVATISSLDFNAEASDRIIAVSIGVVNRLFTAVTIGGVSATVMKAETGQNRRVAVWAAAVPTGTSGSVAVTLDAGGDVAVTVATYSITGADATPTDTDSASANSADLSITALTIPTDGAGLAAYVNAVNLGITWTGAAEAHDTFAGGLRHSDAIITAVGTNTITADGSTTINALVGVAFGPASGGAATSLPIFSRPPRFMRRRAA